MTGWDVFGDTMKNFSPAAITTVVLIAAIVFIIGFCRRGMCFVKYGFGRDMLDSSLEKRLDDLSGKMATKEDLAKRTTLDSSLEKRLDALATKEDLAKRTTLDSSLEKRLDALSEKMATKEDLGKMATKEDLGKMATKEDLNGMAAELQTIKVNHFGHLKNFLTELTSILLDKGIINNENKARLDNQLSGM